MGWGTPGLENPTEAEETHSFRRQETWLLVSSPSPCVTLVGLFLPSGTRFPQPDKGGWSEVCAHPRPCCDAGSPSSPGLVPISNWPWRFRDSGRRPGSREAGRGGRVPGFPPRCRWSPAPSSAIVLMGGLSCWGRQPDCSGARVASLFHQSSLCRGGDQS